MLKQLLLRYFPGKIFSLYVSQFVSTNADGCHDAHLPHAGGDQGLLNVYWGDWATKDIKYHLPFIYNVVPNVTYGYAPAFQR